LLAFEKPALIIPRVKPRLEQWIRAERLRQLGIVNVLHPDMVTPAAMSAWLASDLRTATNTRDLLDFNGLNRLPLLLDELLNASTPIAWAMDYRAGGQYVHVA
jgi:predicted glycosyltransferase